MKKVSLLLILIITLAACSSSDDVVSANENELPTVNDSKSEPIEFCQVYVGDTRN